MLRLPIRLPTHFLAALLGCLLWCSSAQATAFTAAYIFGDSLSDAGNFSLLTGGALPPAPYVGGHFSNGQTSAEIVAQSLGLQALPSLAGGTDYAVGGARTNSFVIPSLAAVASLEGQLGSYFQSTGATADPNALYLLNIGSNDIFDALDQIAGGDLSGGLTTTQNAATLTAQAIVALVDAGAHTLIVPTITDLGLTPAVPSAAQAVAEMLVSSFNGVVDSTIQALLDTDPTLRIVRPDFYSLLQDAVADPAKYGFSNVTTPCYDGFVEQPGTSVCSNPDEYLFWDIMHPTETGQQMMAQLVLADLPEPRSLALVAMAVLMLGVTRRPGHDDVVTGKLR